MLATYSQIVLKPACTHVCVCVCVCVGRESTQKVNRVKH